MKQKLLLTLIVITSLCSSFVSIQSRADVGFYLDYIHGYADINGWCAERGLEGGACYDSVDAYVGCYDQVLNGPDAGKDEGLANCEDGIPGY